MTRSRKSSETGKTFWTPDSDSMSGPSAVALARALRSRPVEFAYLFGSQARGTAGVTSDTDVAVYLRDGLTQSRRWSAEDSVAQALHRIGIPTDRLDLVVLNRVGLLLRFRVIRDGRLLFERAPAQRIQFEAQTMQRYFDWQYYAERGARMAIDRIARHGFA